MIEIKSYSDFKNLVDNNELPFFSFPENGSHKIQILDGSMQYFHDLEVDNVPDYEANYLTSANKKLGNFYQREPFASKFLKNGKSLFRRKHGVKETILANSSKEILINVPYEDCRINKLEVIGANSLDRIDLIVLDTPTGTFSTVPNYPLNQFGFNVVVSDFLYADKSDYDASLIKDMKIKIVYYNDTNSDITVGFNVVFHEVVAP